MHNKRVLFVFTMILLVGLLVGCSLSEPSPPQEPASTVQDGATSEPAGQTPQPEAQPEQQEGSETTPDSSSSINLPVVGVSDPSPTPDPENVGSGQNPVEENQEDTQTGGGQLSQGEIFIDSVEVEIQQGELPRVTLVVSGSLPSPCHIFAFQPEQPDADGRLNVRIYSLSDPEAECAQALQPFEQVVDLGQFPPGSYTLLINGEVLQELNF